MKKIISIICTLALIAGIIGVTGCDAKDKDDGGKIKVICTVFPIYDWTRQIIGENTDKFDLTLLINSGVDLHSYSPTAQEMVNIKNSDVFICIGGESDEWVEDVFKDGESDAKVVNLMETVAKDILLEEDEISEEEHEQDEDEDGEDEEEGPENDEHIWLSVKNAALICGGISEILQEAAPDSAESCKSNAQNYIKTLTELEGRYKAAADSANVKTIVVADRFPFAYLANDYGLDYRAAFSGCSAETEATFEVISSLAKSVNEFGLKSVLVTEGSDQKIAVSVIEQTDGKNQKILVLNAMQSKIEDSETYVSIMESNLEVLREALAN